MDFLTETLRYSDRKSQHHNVAKVTHYKTSIVASEAWRSVGYRIIGKVFIISESILTSNDSL